MSNLQKHEYGDNVHKRCVKLEALCSRTDVVGGREESLGHKSQPEGVEYPVLLGHALPDLEGHLGIVSIG